MSTELRSSGTSSTATLCPYFCAACGSIAIRSFGSYTTWSFGIDDLRRPLERIADPLDLLCAEGVRAVLDVEQPSVFEILGDRAAVLPGASTKCAQAIKRLLIAGGHRHAEVAQRIA